MENALTNRKKNYVLDTNVLLQDEEAVLKFEDNNVYLPVTVIEELDNLKTSRDMETAYNARRANRWLKKAFRNWYDKRIQSLRIPGGPIVVFLTEYSIETNGWAQCSNGQSVKRCVFDESKNDNIILKLALEVQRNTSIPTILVTNDSSMQVKARILGLESEDYKNPQIKGVYTGRRVIQTDSLTIDRFYEQGFLTEDELNCSPLVENEFLLLRSSTDENKNVLAKYNGQRIRPLMHQQLPFSYVKPRKIGQRFAKEALLTDAEELPLVILKGIAGTAKTFLALAAALEMLDTSGIRQILLLRPQSYFDEAIGYLPGDEQSKIDPLLRPFYDNLARILELKGIEMESIQQTIEGYFYYGKIRAEAFTYIQGRSITNSFIIVDEVQNATPMQVKGAVTRAGENSKIVLCGDTMQITNPRCDIYNNGLTYISNKMMGSPLCAQIAFLDEECQRSRLAAEASIRMQ